MTRTILWPEASDLDTVGNRSDYSLKIYLDPDTCDDEVRICLHGGVGNTGSPEPAWHGRWAHIGTVGADVIGESVLAALRSCESAILDAAADYRGSRWDGSNYRGVWEDGCEPAMALSYAWDRAVEDHLRHAWHACDWYVDASWASLCAEHGLDPDDGEQLIDALEEAEAGRQAAEAVTVTGTRDHLAALLRDYLDHGRDEGATAA